MNIFNNVPLINNDRLIIIRPGALGDTLLLAPVLRAIRESKQDLSIGVIGTWPYMELLHKFGVCDHLFSFDRFDLCRSSRKDTSILKSATVIAFMKNPCGELHTDPLTAKGASRVLWAPSRPEKTGLHIVDHEYIVCRTFFPEIRPLSKSPFSMAGHTADCPEQPYAVIAPGAGSLKKCLPLESFLHIAEKKKTKGIRPVFVIGEAEVENGMIRRIPETFSTIIMPRLTDLAYILHGATAVYANDSGVAHLAALMGAKTTVFFGPTDPETWHPWGENIKIIRFS